MNKALLHLIALLIGINCTVGQNFSDSLNVKLSKLYKDSKLPGFSISIVDSSQILYQTSFGYANMQEQIPYSSKTIQPVASVSKTFIAVAVMKAIEMGYFTLETNINEILPFMVINPYFPSDSIKIKHLVTHTSGISDNLSYYLNSYYLIGNTDSKCTEYSLYERIYFKRLAKNSPMLLGNYLKEALSEEGKLYKKRNFNKSKAGESYEYSNHGAALAAYAIEIATGKSFKEFTEEYIFEPLRMNSTSWECTIEENKSNAILYSTKTFPLPLYSNSNYPDGGLNTTSNDLCYFLIEMIKGYNNHGSILCPKSYNTMFSAHYQIPESKNQKYKDIAVIWEKTKKGIVGHTGSDYGVTAFMYYYPNKKVGILLITNIECGESKELMAQFLSIWKTGLQYVSQLVKC